MSVTKILIVEDDLNWLEIFHALVGNDTKELFEYVHVGDLASALSIVKKDSFGLILLDLMLPDSEALNTIISMREHVKTIPIVAVTTLDDEKLIQNAFCAGVEDYIIKDQYDIKVYIHVCRQAIRRFFGKMTHDIDEDLKRIFSHLESVDSALEKWQKDNTTSS